MAPSRRHGCWWRIPWLPGHQWVQQALCGMWQRGSWVWPLLHVQVATWLTSQLNADWVTCFTGEIGVSNHLNGIPHSCTEVSEGVFQCSSVFNVDWVLICTGVGGIDQLVSSDIGSWDPGDPDLVVANSLCCNISRTSRRSCMERSQGVVGSSNN